MLKNCMLCSRKCNVNRLAGETGYCNSSEKVKLARAELHHWEEPCVSGKNGSGTVFFSNCNLHCVFCQNHLISHGGKGSEVSIERLSEIFLELQKKGAHNINLVTPTHYAPQIIVALKNAKKLGLTIPILYNTNGYDSLETIKLLEGYIDVYLPDLKYFNDKFSTKYSDAPSYFENASNVISSMVNQVGPVKFNEEGIITKGVIVRHLMLPKLLFDSKKIIDFLFNKFGDSIFISIMNQYTPMYMAKQYDNINSPLKSEHYDSLIEYALSLGVKNAFIQAEGTCTEAYVPEF